MNTCKFKNLKTGILVMFFLSFILASCAQSEPKRAKEVSILWSEIDQGVGVDVGDILEVVLPANSSTADVWKVGFYNQSVLQPYGEPEFTTTGTNPGAEKSQLLHFEAIGEGETELVLIHQRSSENEGADQETFQVHVTVK